MESLTTPAVAHATIYTSCAVSYCRHCKFYQPEGRRGGQCDRLSALVQGSWQACAIARPVFTSADVGAEIGSRETSAEDNARKMSEVLC